MSTQFETVIGLEVHGQLFTKSKLFCGCSTAFGSAPNSNICPVCLGLPGALPVPNKRAVQYAVYAGLALGCTIRERSQFARKNYFYPDLPKGYQISQFDLPLCEHGYLDIDTPAGQKRVRIRRIHMEDDAAKNTHGAAGKSATLVDYNRSGTALIEIVSEPDLSSSEEAEAYLKRLREILMFLGVNDGNLEEGSFRCDANVSIRPIGQKELGTRAELKNINSFRFVRLAIDHEVARQEALIRAGKAVVQETRLWNEAEGKTYSMRGKEDAHDYRYFPDPDLPVLQLDAAFIDQCRRELPELPSARRERWQREWGLTAYDAGVLTGHPEVARFFEQVAAGVQQALDGKLKREAAGKRAANFIQSEVLGKATFDGLRANFPVRIDQLVELLVLLERGDIHGKMAKTIYAELEQSPKLPSEIIKEKGLAQVSDRGAIEELARSIIAANPAQVEKYRAGKTSVLGFFVGQIMKETQGSANPAVVNDVLAALLKS